MRSDVMEIFEEAGLVKVNQEGFGCATPMGLAVLPGVLCSS
jgi:hypothetical protein